MMSPVLRRAPLHPAETRGRPATRRRSFDRVIDGARPPTVLKHAVDDDSGQDLAYVLTATSRPVQRTLGQDRRWRSQPLSGGCSLEGASMRKSEQIRLRMEPLELIEQ